MFITILLNQINTLYQQTLKSKRNLFIAEMGERAHGVKALTESIGIDNVNATFSSLILNVYSYYLDQDIITCSRYLLTLDRYRLNKQWRAKNTFSCRNYRRSIGMFDIFKCN